MSKKVQNPNQSSNTGFIWAIIAILVIAAVVVGIFVYNSRSAKSDELAANKTTVEGVTMNYNKDDGVIALTATEGGEEAPAGSLFEDYSCVYCAELSAATDDQMLSKIQEGKLEVDIHPLNFLDRGSEGNSTNVLAASLAIADSGNVEAYWNFRETIMEQQSEVYNKWGNSDFANLAGAFGADEETVQAIENGDYLEDAKQVGQSNADYLNEATGSVSSPRVLIDGEDYSGADLKTWVDEVALP